MASTSTTRETVGLLCKSIVTRLENRKSITLPPRLRQVVQDEVQNLINPMIMTDQDLREKTLAKIGASAEVLQDTTYTDSDKYKTAKSMVRASFGDDVLNGFYFLKPVKTVAETIVQYMMRSSHIDDVFETDEDLIKQIVEIIQKFNPADQH